MIILQAPHTLIQCTTILPNPEFGDSEGLSRGMTLKTAQDGTLYTHIKTNSRETLSYNFKLTREKALELEAFMKAYYGEDIRLTNHKDEVWVVKSMNEIFDFTNEDRCENYSIVLNFEGIRIV